MSGKLGRERVTTQRALVFPNNVQLAWAAGFIEGEGSFRADGNVRAAQKSTEPLERLLTYFGGQITINNQGCFYWDVCGSRARGVAMTIYPFLTKRRRAQARKML